MCFIVTFALLIGYVFSGNEAVLIASSLFAIAGAIEVLATRFRDLL